MIAPPGLHPSWFSLAAGPPADRTWEQPIVASLAEVAEWATGHGIRFRDWEDLRAVNEARDTAKPRPLVRFARRERCHDRRAA